MKKGLFISFEGPDGAGKSTQLAMLAEYCRSKGLDITVTREPGGTSISEKIRCIILDPENSEMSASCEALLYAASRAQLIDQLIRPAVEEGRIVLCDRFVDSSIAYQAYARGLGEGVRLINRFAIKGTMPDCTFFLDIDPEKGRERNVDAGKKDRMEQEELSFHRAVYDGYKKIAEMEPERVICIDADRKAEEIFEDIKREFDKLTGEE
ncbi:MAG: dTMP kinase [Firmicutes bacterium]|nr:dTMP kinase [Bacillota bacterium]